MVLAGGTGRGLLGRLGGPGGQRRGRQGGGEDLKVGGLGGRRAQQAAHEGAVQGGDGFQGVVEAGDRRAEKCCLRAVVLVPGAGVGGGCRSPGGREPVHLRGRGGAGREFQVGEVAQEAAEDGGGGLVGGRLGAGSAHVGGDARRRRLLAAVGGVQAEVAGDAGGAVLEYGLLDQGQDVVAEAAAGAAAGAVVVGAASVCVGAGGDRRDVDPFDVRAAGDDALEAAVGQFDERDLGEFAWPGGRGHPGRACRFPLRQRVISFSVRGGCCRGVCAGMPR